VFSESVSDSIGQRDLMHNLDRAEWPFASALDSSTSPSVKLKRYALQRLHAEVKIRSYMLSITAHSASPRIINENSWLEKPRRESGAYSVSPRSSRTDLNVPGDCQDRSAFSHAADALPSMVTINGESGHES
jgi:hypothetical protein